MCEILIYDRDYEESYFKLDIVEVRPDGYYGEPDEPDKHGWNHETFLMLKIPGLPVDSDLIQSLMDGDIVIRKRRFSLDDTKIPANALTKLRRDRWDVVPDTWLTAYLKDNT